MPNAFKKDGEAGKEVTPAPAAETGEVDTASPDASLENDFASTLNELETPDDSASVTPEEGDLDVVTPPAEEPVPDTATETPLTDEEQAALADEALTPAEKQAAEEEAAKKAKEEDPSLEELVVESTEEPFPEDQMKAHRDEALKFYAERYSIDEETANAYLANPAEVLPKLAADMHIGIMENVVAVMKQMVPQLITQISTQTAREGKLDEAFYGAWPQLNTAELRKQVDDAKILYKNQYPQATMKKMIADVGMMVAIQNNLGPTIQTDEPSGDQPDGNVRPFVPAAPGAQTPPAAKPVKSDNLYENFAEEDLSSG